MMTTGMILHRNFTEIIMEDNGSGNLLGIQLQKFTSCFVGNVRMG